MVHDRLRQQVGIERQRRDLITAWGNAPGYGNSTSSTIRAESLPHTSIQHMSFAVFHPMFLQRSHVFLLKSPDLIALCLSLNAGHQSLGLTDRAIEASMGRAYSP